MVVGSVWLSFLRGNHETGINPIQRFSVFYRLCDGIGTKKIDSIQVINSKISDH
jgi:hypothetical protein